MNRTFSVQEYAEDDFGQRAKDEVTGEQGHVDDERSCFWTWDDTEGVWQSRPFKGRLVNRRKGKRKRKRQRQRQRKRKRKRKRRKKRGKHPGTYKGSGRAFLGEEQAQDSEMWSEKDFAWWNKGRKGKKGLSKGNDGFQKGVFSPLPARQRRSQGLFPKQRKRKVPKRKRQGRSPSSIRTFIL